MKQLLNIGQFSLLIIAFIFSVSFTQVSEAFPCGGISFCTSTFERDVEACGRTRANCVSRSRAFLRLLQTRCNSQFEGDGPMIRECSSLALAAAEDRRDTCFEDEDRCIQSQRDTQTACFFLCGEGPGFRFNL